MLAMFDRNSDLVGWMDPGRHIWDTDVNWIAYIAGGHAWSAATGNWLGPINGVNCLDHSGRVVAWNPAGTVAGTARPARPARAARAARPARPARPARLARPARPAVPAGGWSSLTFPAWVSQ